MVALNMTVNRCFCHVSYQAGIFLGACFSFSFAILESTNGSAASGGGVRESNSRSGGDGETKRLGEWLSDARMHDSHGRRGKKFVHSCSSCA